MHGMGSTWSLTFWGSGVRDGERRVVLEWKDALPHETYMNELGPEVFAFSALRSLRFLTLKEESRG